MDLKRIGLIIYDLDGTLYEDTHHFDYYAKQLKQRLPENLQDTFQAEYEAALRDEHPLRIGRAYDASNDLILVQVKGHVSEVYRWDGTPVTDAAVLEQYQDGITIDMEKIFSVGDLWWVPGVIARHYGMKEAQTTEAFLATREYMMGPDFKMNPIPGLKDAIEASRANGVKQVLLTNSPQIDSEKILDKLGLLHSLDEKIFNGRKPTGTKGIFERISAQFDMPFDRILSVGDNWINEIQPAIEFGCQTVYIDPHNIGAALECDKRVSSMQEVLEIIRTAGK